MSYAIDKDLDNNEPKLTDHSYDGIQEYDNPMPGWWVWLFVATVLYSGVYWLYFETGVADRSIFDDYRKHQDQVMQAKFGELGDLSLDAATLVRYSSDPKEAKWLAVGQSNYVTNCASCHGIDGGGGIGPNLTDDHWKSVRRIEDIASVIKNGANNGAMPAWGTRFNHPNILVLTSAYIASLRGSTPSNPKAPEGNVIGPWTAAEPAAPVAPTQPAN
ncbi:MAG: cbb3-type cytochrome c oxidase N-terminal domain-containing protein [Pirellulaceae bacterium]|nr:cbb3-type cytochrome c oxidase N-terminal domain-containing protein [Pirellulaceae bacterium]